MQPFGDFFLVFFHTRWKWRSMMRWHPSGEYRQWVSGPSVMKYSGGAGGWSLSWASMSASLIFSFSGWTLLMYTAACCHTRTPGCGSANPARLGDSSTKMP